MKRRYITSSFIACTLLFLFVSSAVAQNLRPEDTFYIKPRIGISEYSGDRDPNIFDFEDFGADKFPYSAALEVGYQFSPGLGLAAYYQVAEYPTIMPEDWYTRRHTAGLLLRYMFGARTSRLAPFVEIGGHGSTGYTDFSGGDESDEYSFGPSVGLGLDIALNNRTSLVFEWLTNISLPDFNTDGAEGPGLVTAPDHNWSPEGSQVDLQEPGDEEGFFSSFDALSFLGVGLKINFKSAFTPVEVLSLDCPATVTAGESATFSAVTNDEDATQPISYTWDFGDGSTAEGLLATHTYQEAGSYTVSFTATNDGTSSSQTCAVTVEPPPVPASIVSVAADPQTFDVCEPQEVQFSANVRGTEPVEYNWNFGDGSTGRGANPTHTYDTPGTYTVTLEVSNEFGTDQRSVTVTAEPCIPEICFEVTEMNPVFFGRNSSTLTEEGREALQENLELFSQCPNLNGRIEGFAAPGERNPESLSEDRARAVEQFYIDNGISADRFETVGMGRVTGVTSKKEGASQYRRVDTIPQQTGR